MRRAQGDSPKLVVKKCNQGVMFLFLDFLVRTLYVQVFLKKEISPALAGLTTF